MTFAGFNPCCDGNESVGRVDGYVRVSTEEVSILVVMETSQWAQVSLSV